MFGFELTFFKQNCSLLHFFNLSLFGLLNFDLIDLLNLLHLYYLALPNLVLEVQNLKLLLGTNLFLSLSNLNQIYDRLFFFLLATHPFQK